MKDKKENISLEEIDQLEMSVCKDMDKILNKAMVHMVLVMLWAFILMGLRYGLDLVNLQILNFFSKTSAIILSIGYSYVLVQAYKVEKKRKKISILRKKSENEQKTQVIKNEPENISEKIFDNVRENNEIANKNKLNMLDEKDQIKILQQIKEEITYDENNLFLEKSTNLCEMENIDKHQKTIKRI